MRKDKPRYSRLSDIIDLVFYIQNKPQGVTLKEISSRTIRRFFNVHLVLAMEGSIGNCGGTIK